MNELLVVLVKLFDQNKNKQSSFLINNILSR